MQSQLRIAKAWRDCLRFQFCQAAVRRHELLVTLHCLHHRSNKHVRGNLWHPWQSISLHLLQNDSFLASVFTLGGYHFITAEAGLMRACRASIGHLHPFAFAWRSAPGSKAGSSRLCTRRPAGICMSRGKGLGHSGRGLAKIPRLRHDRGLHSLKARHAIVQSTSVSTA